jgi:hypothetical protein
VRRSRTPACLLLAIAAPVAAQVAQAPRVQPGDRWEFSVVPSATPRRTWVVAAVTADRISATENGAPLLLTADLGPLDSPLLRQANPMLLRFPLQVGQRWSYVNDVAFKDNGSTAKVQVDVEVQAHERVKVPAGEFDAWRLQSRSRIDGRSYAGAGAIQGEGLSTYWYAPAARAIVKSINWSTYRGEATTELVSYQLGK